MLKQRNTGLRKRVMPKRNLFELNASLTKVFMKKPQTSNVQVLSQKTEALRIMSLDMASSSKTGETNILTINK